MNNKFYIEKVLHELVRDLPEVKRANDMYEKGLLSLEEVFLMVAAAVLAEKVK